MGVTSCSAAPPSATQIGTRLFFLAEDDEHGCELWVTDGTAEGTALVRDIFSGPRSAFTDGEQQLIAFGDTLLFAADDAEHGRELWIAGPAVETAIVKDICEGPCSSLDADPQFPTYAHTGGIVVFVASDQTHGAELWRTDGTPDGTVLVKDIRPGALDSIFLSRDYSDYVPYLTVLNGFVLFAASDRAHGLELWRTDGTEAQTLLVRDINPGTASSLLKDGIDTLVNDPAGSFTASDGKIFFSAIEADGEIHSWESDGTFEGTNARLENPGFAPSTNDTGCSISRTGAPDAAVLSFLLLPLVIAATRRFCIFGESRR
jgi:ELWxxDGT repeat protein